MRIFQMRAENLQSLRMVEIKPRKGVTLISGPNGSGKSTVLAAPSWALGGKGALPAVPVRTGEESGAVTLHVGTEAVEFIVTRTIEADGRTTLTVKAPDGASYKRPQEMVSKWIGAISFDVAAFLRMKPAEQLAELQRIAPLPPEVDGWRKQISISYDERTDVNRRAKDLTGKLRGAATAPPEITHDVDAITDRLARVGEVNATRDAERRRRTDEYHAIGQTVREGERLNAEALEMMKRATAMIDDARRRTEALEALPAVEENEDASAIRGGLEIARAQESAARAWEMVEADRKQLADLEAQSKALTDLLEKLEDQIRASIAAVKMPVRGLSYGTDGITFNGLPFAQASTAQALRVSAGIAMAMNPTLRVLFVREWSLLDADSRETLEDLAAEHGFDIIGEVVGDAPVGFVMREGEVVAVDGEPVTAGGAHAEA